MTKKREQRVGSDGYYYFAYNVNAAYAVKTATGTVTYEIVEAIYREGEQSYTVRVSGKQETRHREMSLQRLNYVLKNAEVTNEGTPEELPVTKEEVELYYIRCVRLRNKRKREATAKLKEDKEYQKLLAEEKELTPKWAQAIRWENALANELEKRVAIINAKKRAILDKLDVRLSDLKTSEPCEVCAGKGITSKGKICECAFAIKNEIKAYCAAERLVERKKEEQMNEISD